MPAATYNFQLEKGSDFEINFQYNDINNTPIDLTNKIVVFQICGDDKLYHFSSESNASYNINDWSLSKNNIGNINIKIASIITKNFNFASGTGTYDLDVISVIEDGSVKNSVRIATGTISLVNRNLPLLSINNTNPSGNNLTCSGTIPSEGGSQSNTVVNFDSNNLSGSSFIGTNLSNCNFSNANFANAIMSGVDLSLANLNGVIGVIIDNTSPPTSLPPINSNIEDFCLPKYCTLDSYSQIYSSSGIVINDLSIGSGSININDPRKITNVEVYLKGLHHSSPQDLWFILAPASGNKVLLSANSKINNYNSSLGFSWMFSNKAQPATYMHNVNNNGLCNIYSKTGIINYGETLQDNFNHLINYANTGNWTLYIHDNDIGGSGYLNYYQLLITYEASNEPEQQIEL